MEKEKTTKKTKLIDISEEIAHNFSSMDIWIASKNNMRKPEIIAFVSLNYPEFLSDIDEILIRAKKLSSKEEMKELSEKIEELIKNAPEKPWYIRNRYNTILINPKNKDDWESGYKNLEIFGVIKSECGLFVEKLWVSDVLNINSFFKKLKRFGISIDILHPGKIICISCDNYLFEVSGSKELKFVKNKE